MLLDRDICYRAVLTRDARFDGRFFTGVRSTGIYCRPVCPAKPPKLENCMFLPSAAAAREAGFRPCLRCRPEASPGTPAWLGTSATVSRALRLIGEGALDDGTVADLADRLGVGERHLRRLFLRHLGATPVAVAQTRRILFAKKLIDRTALPMSAIAFSAGFGSIRRFNAAIRGTYGRPPAAFRRRRPESGGRGSAMVLTLPYRPPYNWPALMRYLAARAIPGVEHVTADGYRRTIATDEATGTFAVSPAAERNALAVRLRLSGPVELIRVVERLRRQFDLGADPEVIADYLGTDPRLAPAVAGLPGLRVAGAWDGFELAVRAILGQQVSVKGATTMAGRLVAAFGAPIATGEAGLDFLFPTPATLAAADLTTLGLTRARARTINALAAAVASGTLTFSGTGSLDETIAALMKLPGIGEWTAHYIAMRCFGEPDAFPATDLGLLKAYGGGAPVSPTVLRSAAEAWRPWRAYAAMYLWSAGAAAAVAREPARRAASVLHGSEERKAP